MIQKAQRQSNYVRLDFVVDAVETSMEIVTAIWEEVAGATEAFESSQRNSEMPSEVEWEIHYDSGWMGNVDGALKSFPLETFALNSVIYECK